MFAERMNNKGNNHQGYNDYSWGGQVRKSYDYYNQNSNNRGEYQQQQHEGGKIEQRMQNLRLEGSSGGNKASNESSSGPKKMTWATIASQPAKPQISTTNTATKKKGPGMPPPPMIPGKHNIDLNDGWDAPKNIVPPSPPVITAPPVDLSLDKQNNSNFEQPAWPTPEQAVSQNNNQQGTQNSNNHSQTPPTQQQQNNHNLQQQQQLPSHHANNNNNNQRGSNNSGGGYHHMNNNSNKYDKYENSGSSYHGRQYNQNSGSNQHYNNSSSSSYNDYQKPYHQHPHQMPSAPSHQQIQQTNSGNNNNGSGGQITRASMQPPQHQQQQSNDDVSKQLSDESILEKLRVKNQYNPSELDLSLVDKARFFVIKSYSEDDIHRSIKYEIWCSTEHGNKRLDQAFREREKENGVIYLFFSVNSSGHFCGVAQMITPVDYSSNSSVWSQDKWKGSFRVKWVYVKDVPNTQLRHIRLENNENKPVTNSRDTQEVPNSHGIQIMKIVHSYKHTTSIFDDFTHYEKRQEEEDSRKNEAHDSYTKMTLPASHHSSHNREYNNSGGFDRNNYNNNGNYNKYGSNSGGGYNNDYKQNFNSRGGGYNNKRNDFRNDRNGDQPSGFYRAKDYSQDREDFGNRSGSSSGYRSDRGGSRGRGGFRSMNHN